MLAVRKTGKKKLIIGNSVNPIYRVMLRSYTANLSLELIEADLESPEDLKGLIDNKTAAVIVQYPRLFRAGLRPLPLFRPGRREQGPGHRGLLSPGPGFAKKPRPRAGADIVVGEGQCLGLPLSFGGPYLGYMAVSKKFIRAMPGRVAGKTVDHEGKVGYCLTLQDPGTAHPAGESHLQHLLQRGLVRPHRPGLHVPPGQGGDAGAGRAEHG